MSVWLVLGNTVSPSLQVRTGAGLASLAVQVTKLSCPATTCSPLTVTLTGDSEEKKVVSFFWSFNIL